MQEHPTRPELVPNDDSSEIGWKVETYLEEIEAKSFINYLNYISIFIFNLLSISRASRVYYFSVYVDY
ncbi:hypothetical protein HanRHA438_Chr17g0826791 [Helianthus annuus]|uniref:Uncharacterized protein n=1 Tax=Helianthus annuus TaxID=4232 RepID=A0A251RSE7_HELAN|nr:hypothetical protein HanXRQr2_Chr17g0816721 [Helianthus annuus]KAJ0814333.1 hypothetical protein HanPSC8_Chr17g0784401 [Helianthus annuus]KAJ0827525.1 hypothetical protein HanRHA438_Chr17g0826791 [Helianthus annuus]